MFRIQAIMLAMECSRATPPARREAAQFEVLSGGDSDGDPPVPIPNTEVKPASADGTWGADPWESRTPPGTLLARGAVSLERGGLSVFLRARTIMIGLLERRLRTVLIPWIRVFSP